MTAQPLLSLVQSDTATAPAAPSASVTILSTTDATQLFADYLVEQSWCIDVTSYPFKALHTNSNRPGAIEAFKLQFPAWARANRVRVNTSDYQEFLKYLGERLTAHLPRIYGKSFKPVDDRFFESQGITLANTFVPFNPELPDEFQMPKLLERYLQRAFMTDQDRKYITEWMADIIQNPSRRPQWGVILTGDHGTGKSTIFRIVRAALGGRHVWDKGSYAPAFSQFSEVFPDNLLVVFDDAVATKDTYERLKSNMTKTLTPVEIKGVQEQVQREVYARVLVCSNDRSPLPKLPAGDRRFYVADYIEHPDNDPKATAEFFEEFNDWFDLPSTPAMLRHWLMTIDLKAFKPGSTIKTEALAKMAGLSTPQLDTLIAEYVSGGLTVHNAGLVAHLAEYGYRNPDPDRVRDIMSNLNYQDSRRVVPGCGDKQQPLWQPIPKGKKRAPALTSEEIEGIQKVVCPDFQNP